MTLFDLPGIEPEPAASYGRRLTIRAHNAIANGHHPANGLPVNLEHSCDDCAHLNRYKYHNRPLLKCQHHRLGESHSEASDMRASWPACPKWEQRP